MSAFGIGHCLFVQHRCGQWSVMTIDDVCTSISIYIVQCCKSHSCVRSGRGKLPIPLAVLKRYRLHFLNPGIWGPVALGPSHPPGQACRYAWIQALSQKILLCGFGFWGSIRFGRIFMHFNALIRGTDSLGRVEHGNPLITSMDECRVVHPPKPMHISPISAKPINLKFITITTVIVTITIIITNNPRMNLCF